MSHGVRFCLCVIVLVHPRRPDTEAADVKDRIRDDAPEIEAPVLEQRVGVLGCCYDLLPVLRYRGTWYLRYRGTVVLVPSTRGVRIISLLRQAALRAHAMLLPASILALLSVRVAAVSLVTVATDATEGFCDLAWSAIVHGHVLHVLEWASAGAEFTVATSKMEALAAFAREAAATSPDELVLTVDGYDVIVQASPAAITRQVREVAPGVALGDTVLFSGENYCAPSFSLGGRPRCVAAYPKAAYHVSCSADHSM